MNRFCYWQLLIHVSVVMSNKVTLSNKFLKANGRKTAYDWQLFVGYQPFPGKLCLSLDGRQQPVKIS